MAALIVLAALPASAGDLCATRSELNGLNVRVLQTKLMIGAIACNQRKEYNNFVRRFKSDLKEYSQNMQGYFSRNYRDSAAREQDSFVTRLANNMSGNNVTASGRSEFCGSNGELFREVAASNADLASISDSGDTAAAHGIRPCTNLAELSR